MKNWKVHIQRQKGTFYLSAAALILAAVLLPDFPRSAQGRVIRKTEKDGTVRLYNVPNYSFPKGDRKKMLHSRYDDLITKIAGGQGVDPELVKCIVRVESDFNPDAVSPSGAMGLMQIMDDTARIYKLGNPFDPEANLNIGVRHFKGLLNYFRNDVPLALAAYHAGLGRVKSRMAIPPIKATIDYVNAVMYLYSGKNDFQSKVMKLYRKIEKDGTILLYSK